MVLGTKVQEVYLLTLAKHFKRVIDYLRAAEQLEKNLNYHR